MTFTTNAYGLGYGGAGGWGLSVVGLVNTDVHVSQRGHDGQAFGTHEQMPSASFIWVGTRQVCICHTSAQEHQPPLADRNPQRVQSAASSDGAHGESSDIARSCYYCGCNIFQPNQ